MKKRIIAVVLAVVLVTGGLSSVAYALDDNPVNEVEARFVTDLNYGPWPDTFTNGDEISLSWENWEAKMGNSPDGTGANVTALTLSLDSGVPFREVSNGNLTEMRPPTYEWSFGDVPEGSGEVKAHVGLVSKVYDPPITFTPGFDASRSVDKAEFLFSDGPQQTQVLTVTVTPRQRTELGISLGADENDLISPLIISAISGDGVEYPTDGHRVNIYPITGLEPNITWTLTVTFQVTPKKPKVRFIPYVEVGWSETIASGTTPTPTSSLSYPAGDDPAEEPGTWTWSAEGSYEWHWIQELRPGVHWFTRCREIVNEPPVAQASVDPYLAPVGSDFTFDGSASSGAIVSYDWDFGDGTSDSGVSVTHAYATPELYDVVLTVTDDMGAESTDSVMAVVYDPTAGFATGGGWFIPGGKTSYDNDYLPNIDGTSPANFGFVVKYKKGASTPDGQLEFQYQQGDFNLHSSGMEWLVITNKNWAKFQGLATIKGLDGLYPFHVDARDGDFGGGDQPDCFIIKVYPAGGDPDVDDPIYKASGDLEGGSIVIHAKK